MDSIIEMPLVDHKVVNTGLANSQAVAECVATRNKRIANKDINIMSDEALEHGCENDNESPSILQDPAAITSIYCKYYIPSTYEGTFS
jgi:hypothetical protein